MCLRFNVAKMDLEPGSSANVRILRFDTATRRILSAALPPHGNPPAEPCARGYSEPMQNLADLGVCSCERRDLAKSIVK
jgi:hypothetical protein